MYLCHELVPLFVFISHGLVHKLVRHPVAAAVFQEVGKLEPQIDQILLSFLRGKENVGILSVFIDGIEIVGTDDVQIHDGTQIMLAAPVEGILQQVPGLRQFVSLLIPELHLVDGDTHEVEAQLFKTCEVIFLDMESARLTTLFRLRQPVTDIGATLDTEVIHFSCLCKARHRNTQCHYDHGDCENILSHNHL